MAVRLRREYRLSRAEIADQLRVARSTVARWLCQAGTGCLNALDPKDPPRRQQRERAPGERIHLDIKTLGRFERAGHRVTGRRTGCRNTGTGSDFVHLAIDDATHLADGTRGTTTAFLIRALRWLRARGVKAERIMPDNGSASVSRRFAKVLRRLDIRHIRTRPYRPKTNGKAERVIQTLPRRWAYAIPHRSSDSRKRGLPGWLTWYDEHRPHAALRTRPPATPLSNPTRTHTERARKPAVMTLSVLRITNSSCVTDMFST